MAERWTSASTAGTWAGFVKFIEWSMGGIIVIMVLLAIFRTH